MLALKSVHAALEAYRALFLGAVGSLDALAQTLARTTPLLLTGLAVAVALRAGLFNIGGQGQMVIGALASAFIGFSVPGPAPLVLALSLLAGALCGALWAWLPIFLKEKRGAHEVITAILLNYAAAKITHFLASGPLKAPGETPQTPEVSALLPRLFPAYDVHAGLVVGLVALGALALMLFRTVWGYELRTVGMAPDAARAAGIAVVRVRYGAFLLSGALAGLAGAIVVCGETPFRRFPADFSSVGYGFEGLAVAMLAGGGSLWTILPAALLFGALGAGAEAMAFETQTPKQLVMVLEAILIASLTVRIARRGGRP
jgi:simple sugar transport system permease protein